MEQISIKDLIPLIEEVTTSGTSFRLYPKGTSMNPYIIENEDSVLLSKPDDIKFYDIVLYRRDSGQYVLHRVVSKHGDYFDMCGDNQLFYEKNIHKKSVIAKVTGIYKKDTLIDVSSSTYRKDIKKFYRKKTVNRIIAKIKKVIYPAYKTLFK